MAVWSLALVTLSALAAAFSPVHGFLAHCEASPWRTGSLSLSAHEQCSEVSRRRLFTSVISGAVIPPIALSRSLPASARLEGINKPELLPSEPGLNVIQTEKFLTSGQAKRMDELLGKLERDTGYRLRVLCQAYPNTPGLAIRDYWSLGKEGQKDDKYIVLVVDQFGGKGNVLNFNVGEGVKFALPNSRYRKEYVVVKILH
jgi:hypothetical protein